VDDRDDFTSGSELSSRRSSWPWILGAVLLLFVFGSLAGWALVTPVVDSTPPAVLPQDTVGGPNRAELFGNGRYVAIQTYDVSGLPVVSVWDSQNLSETTVSGYVLAAAEPAGPVLWLVPVTLEEWSDLYLGSGALAFERPHDVPPASLVVWDVESEDDPTAAAPARWRTIEGPGEFDAYFEVNPLKGVQPSKLLFNNKASQGEGHAAKLPEEVVTFIPRGWSSSGEYIAIEQMILPEGDTDVGPQWSAESYERRQILIVEAQTGEVAAAAVLGTGALTPGFWHQTEDVLMWVADTDAGEGGTGFTLRALEVGSQPQSASARLGFTPLDEWDDAWAVTLAGSGATETLLIIDTDSGYRISSVGPSGVTDSGGLDFFESAVFGDAAGLAVLETEFDEQTGDEWLVLAVYDEHGQGRRVVWRAANALACDS